MARRTLRQARALGLWTAGWLFVLLLGGVLWLGELSLQWPVLVVPVLWALVALRPRRRPPAVRDPRDDETRVEESQPPRGGRPYPETRELPWLPEVPPGDRREE